MTRLFAITTICISMTACTLKVEENSIDIPEVNIGTTKTDTSLDLTKFALPNSDFLLSYSNLTNDKKLDLASNSFLLFKKTQDKKYKVIAQKIMNQFYSDSSNYLSFSTNDSPYFNVIANEGDKLLTPVLNDNTNFLLWQERKIENVLKNSAGLENIFQWPKESDGLLKTVGSINGFLNWFNEAMIKNEVDPDIRQIIMQTIDERYKPMIEEINLLSEQLNYTKDFSNSLSVTREIIRVGEMDLEQETKDLLDSAEQISSTLNDAPNASKVLLALVMIWEQMDDGTRKETFGAVSEDLFNYLNESGDYSRNCLKKAICLNLLTVAAKRLVIVPQIKNMGVTDIVDTVNESAAEYIVEEVNSQMLAYLKSLPDVILEKVSEEFRIIRLELSDIKHSTNPYVMEKVSKWSKHNLPGRFLKVEGDGKSSGNTQIDTSASIIANSLKANALFLNSLNRNEMDDTGSLTVGLSQISKVAALLGYRKSDNTNPQSLFIDPFTGKKAGAHDLYEAAISEPDCDLKTDKECDADQNNKLKNHLFYLPEKMTLDNKLAPLRYSDTFSATDFPKLISALSAWAEFSKDWKDNTYNDSLGKTKLSDLISTIPKDQIDYGLFQKDIMYIVTVFSLSEVLGNITKENTHIFRINNKNEYFWVNEDGGNVKTPAVMTGSVDIKNKKRNTEARALDNALLILAIIDFFEAINGIEQSSSIPLISDENSSPLDGLDESKKDLKLLIITLSNFLSNKLLNENGLIANSYNLDTHKTSEAPETLEVQLKSIQALIAASEFLDINLYKYAAIDIYYSMNKHFWSDKLNLHSITKGRAEKINTHHVSELLLTLNLVAPLLSNNSHEQVMTLIEGYSSIYYQSLNKVSSLYIVNDSDKGKQDGNSVSYYTDGWYRFSTSVSNN